MSKITSTKLSVSVKTAIKRRLEVFAKTAGRSSSTIAAEAISDYLDLNEAQVAGIHDSIASLDKGQSVPHSRVHQWVRSWGTPHEQSVPSHV